MQDRLTLASATVPVATPAVLANLSDMARDRSPASNLALVVGASPAHVVPAVPLKPAARILRMNPAFALPLAQRLGRVDAEVVERRDRAAAGRVLRVRTTREEIRRGNPSCTCRRTRRAATSPSASAPGAKSGEKFRPGGCVRQYSYPRCIASLTITRIFIGKVYSADTIVSVNTSSVGTTRNRLRDGRRATTSMLARAPDPYLDIRREGRGRVHQSSHRAPKQRRLRP